MPNTLVYFAVGIASAKAQCGPAVSFIAREKELLRDQNITPLQHCSQYQTRSHCKSDEYELCNWCDAHKSTSTSEDQSVRCVPASYHWFECERSIAPPRERIRHKFEWGKKNDEEEEHDLDVEAANEAFEPGVDDSIVLSISDEL